MSEFTTDHEKIRRWAEGKGGRPAAVKRTHQAGDVGIIRIMFPEAAQSEHEALEEISWDEFYPSRTGPVLAETGSAAGCLRERGALMRHVTARNRLEADVYRSVVRRGGPRSTAVRLFTDWAFLVRAVRYALHLPTPLSTEDRRILERVIFRYYASRADMRSVLFVGCQWYTRHYGRMYFGQHDFWTIEPSEESRQFGARQHVIAPLERLDAFFPEGYFDLIVCNGVFGYGLDASEQCESAFDHCYTRLRDGGHFVLGRDDVPERTPILPANIQSLKRFRPVKFPPLGTERYLTDTPYRHLYEFYERA